MGNDAHSARGQRPPSEGSRMHQPIEMYMPKNIRLIVAVIDDYDVRLDTFTTELIPYEPGESIDISYLMGDPDDEGQARH